MGGMKRSRGKVDANSPALDAYAEKCGVSLIKCSAFAELGFDRIYLFRGRIYIVEYKSPVRKWSLTETELKRQEQCLLSQVPYQVIETEAQIAAMLDLPLQLDLLSPREKRQ